MRTLRGIGVGLLYAFAALGLLSGAAWAAHAAGLLYPLVVVSGSMSPGIDTGDLIIGIPKPVDEIVAGDVVTLTSPLTQRLVTHRVIAIRQEAGGDYALTLKGDANDSPDGGEYRVSATSSPPTPWVVIPGAGRIVQSVSQPAVAVPLLIAFAALVGLVTLPSRRDEGGGEPADSPAESVAGGAARAGGAT